MQDKTQIFKECPLFQATNTTKTYNDKNTRIYLSAGWKGFYHLEFGQAVAVCYMPKPCKFTPLDSCQKSFLWAPEEADLTLHPVVGCVLGELFSCTWFRKPGCFSQSQHAESMFQSRRRGWKWRETCRAWTCLRSWWCCTARSCLIWFRKPGSFFQSQQQAVSRLQYLIFLLLVRVKAKQIFCRR